MPLAQLAYDWADVGWVARDAYDNDWYATGDARYVQTPITDPDTNAYLGAVRRRRSAVSWRVPLVTPLTATPTANAAATTSDYFTFSFTTTVSSSTTVSYFADVSGAMQRMLNATVAANTNLLTWSTAVRQATPEQVKATKRKATMARRRAKRLLAEVLTDAQSEQLKAVGYFEVTALPSGNVYRVYQGYSRNVVRLDAQGEPCERLCAHPSVPGMPDEDHMVAQKVYIETLEEEFRKIANKTRIGKVEAGILVGEADLTVATGALALAA